MRQGGPANGCAALLWQNLTFSAVHGRLIMVIQLTEAGETAWSITCENADRLGSLSGVRWLFLYLFETLVNPADMRILQGVDK